MTCHVTEIGGATVVMCTRGGSAKRCTAPGCDRRGEFQCDYPLKSQKSGRTCSKHICRAHSKHVGPDLDYCPAHAATSPQLQLP